MVSLREEIGNNYRRDLEVREACCVAVGNFEIVVSLEERVVVASRYEVVVHVDRDLSAVALCVGARGIFRRCSSER